MCYSSCDDPCVQGDIGLNVAQMIVELIRDNRKIVDRITQDQIEMFVGLLKINKVLIAYRVLRKSQKRKRNYFFTFTRAVEEFT
jgi:hypothetical protein